MRYKETREQTAELLRMILPLMSRHTAGFHPLSYAVWYEYLVGTNPGLKGAVDERVASGKPLSDSDIARLFDDHIVMRDIESSARMRSRIHELIDQVSGAALETESTVVKFGTGLDTYAERLQSPQEKEALKEIVTSMISDTVIMRGHTHSFQEYLQNKKEEVVRLRGELELAQGLALSDPLTGLLNRRGLEQNAQRLFGLGENGSSLLMLDIDHFKAINDTHGHLLGDKVIQAVAQVIKTCAGERAFAARVGGEEFAVLVPHCSAAGAAELAERIRSAVQRGRIRRQDREETIGSVTISIGVAAHLAGEAFESLIARSDEALYQSKEHGRNRVSIAAHRPG